MIQTAHTQQLLPLAGIQRPTPRPAAVAGTTIDARRQIRAQSDRIRERVLRAIADAGSRGVTDAELERILGLSGNTLRPRRRELETAGLVVDSHRRRPTASGRSAIVWVCAHAEEVQS